MLVKATAQAILTYTMSIFELPKELCDSIQRMINKFWCALPSFQSTKRRLVSKDHLCKGKLEGGLGFFKTLMLLTKLFLLCNWGNPLIMGFTCVEIS